MCLPMMQHANVWRLRTEIPGSSQPTPEGVRLESALLPPPSAMEIPRDRQPKPEGMGLHGALLPPCTPASHSPTYLTSTLDISIGSPEPEGMGLPKPLDAPLDRSVGSPEHYGMGRLTSLDPLLSGLYLSCIMSSIVSPQRARDSSTKLVALSWVDLWPIRIWQPSKTDPRGCPIGIGFAATHARTQGSREALRVLAKPASKLNSTGGMVRNTVGIAG